jgi:hypothetical protein
LAAGILKDQKEFFKTVHEPRKKPRKSLPCVCGFHPLIVCQTQIPGKKQGAERKEKLTMEEK